MTRAAAPHALGVPARFFLAAAVAVGLLVGFTTTASATTVPAAQNAVGASTVAVATHVGPSANISPAMSRDSYDSQAITASATGVAADSATAGKALAPRYPVNDGFYGPPSTQTLEVGARIDRYGYAGGTYAAPEGTPFGARSLAPEAASAPYNVYEVLKPLEVDAGPTAPWFGESGMGTQYRLPASVQDLIDQGFLKAVG